MRKTLAAVAAGLMLVTGAQASDPFKGMLYAHTTLERTPKVIPSEIRQRAAEFCEGAGTETSLAEAAQTIDLNGNGRMDWWVNYGIACDAVTLCGTGGCTVEFWIARDDGSLLSVIRERMIDWVYDPDVRRLSLGQHGSYCGVAGAYGCIVTYQVAGETLREIGRAPPASQ